MTIKLIRMWSGEDVIADVIEENEDTITMENPIVACLLYTSDAADE